MNPPMISTRPIRLPGQPEESLTWIMHELSVTESILEIALRHAEKVDAARITDLYLVIGDLATIVDDSVQFYWDLISEGTLAAGAELHFERLPVKVNCQNCGNEYTPPADYLLCPVCDSIDIKILQGEEFFLSAINIEKEPSRESERS